MFTGRSIFTQNLWICRTSLTLFTQVSFHMSRLGFLGLAGDRYLAIVHPLKYRVWGKAINGWIATLVFLVITLIINFPFFMYTQIWPPGMLLHCIVCFSNHQNSFVRFSISLHLSMVKFCYLGAIRCF